MICCQDEYVNGRVWLGYRPSYYFVKTRRNSEIRHFGGNLTTGLTRAWRLNFNNEMKKQLPAYFKGAITFQNEVGDKFKHYKNRVLPDSPPPFVADTTGVTSWSQQSSHQPIAISKISVGPICYPKETTAHGLSTFQPGILEKLSVPFQIFKL